MPNKLSQVPVIEEEDGDEGETQHDRLSSIVKTVRKYVCYNEVLEVKAIYLRCEARLFSNTVISIFWTICDHFLVQFFSKIS